MLEKPLELQGKAIPFMEWFITCNRHNLILRLIDWIKKIFQLYVGGINVDAKIDFGYLDEIVNFFSQPFIPEMLEYFEDEETVKDLFSIYSGKLLIHTLNDFINDFIRSGVELEWK